MRISAKGRYALAALIEMARHYDDGEYITVISISQRLDISKIYLEQVFSQLKKSGLLHSIKGAQGGYLLARMPGQITVLDILSAVEISLFERAEETVPVSAPEIEAALRLSAFDVLDNTIDKTLENITLLDLAESANNNKNQQGYMFYI